MDTKESQILHDRAEQLLKISGGLREIFERRGIEFEVDSTVARYLEHDEEETHPEDQTQEMGNRVGMLRNTTKQLLELFVEQSASGDLNDLNHRERKILAQARDNSYPHHSDEFRIIQKTLRRSRIHALMGPLGAMIRKH